MSGMYERFAKDLSQDLFDSVFSDLYDLANTEQQQIWRRHGRKGYYVGERQQMLAGFCDGAVSLGDAMDAINSAKGK